jgi:uncharacterized protein (TIGR02246 family)
VTETPTVESLLREWVAAFNSRDLDRHVQLYTEDATLFGSVDELQTGRDGIRDYFGGLHAGVRVEAYPMPRTTALATDVTVTAGYVDFADDDGPIPYRMTWVLVRRDGNWRIAQHHGSPRRSP